MCVCVCVCDSVCRPEYVWTCALVSNVYVCILREGGCGSGGSQGLCQPSFSLSSYSGSQPTVYSVTVLRWKAAEWNEFTFAGMFLQNIHMLKMASQLLVCSIVFIYSRCTAASRAE